MQQMSFHLNPLLDMNIIFFKDIKRVVVNFVMNSLLQVYDMRSGEKKQTHKISP